MTVSKSYKCDKCQDKGFIIYEKKDKYGNPYQTSKFCECKIKQDNEERLKMSGLDEFFKRKSFNNFICNTDKQTVIKNKAIDFYKKKSGSIILYGQVGSGKTHLAVALLNNFCANGYSILYKNYKDLVRELSQSALCREEYQAIINRCFNTSVLLIDDLFKGTQINKYGEIIGLTSAQLSYAYEIINYRYSNNKITIITTEKTIDDMMKIDDGLASRIIEMAQDYIINMNGVENHRLIKRA